LAAALQFREGYRMSDLDSSAREFLRLNGINDPSALVQVCDGPDYSHTIPPDQCPVPLAPPRKLVRVVATGTVHLAFLPVIGIDRVPIAAEATSETASVDVVLVIDRSESMTYAAPPISGTSHDPMRDPSVCNNPDDPNFNPDDPNFNTDDTYDSSYTGYCRPFDEVKKAAVSFVEQLYFPYDRVAVVTIDKEAQGILMGGVNFSSDLGDIISTIKGLKVYEGAGVYPNGNPSLHYDPNPPYYYWGLDCPQKNLPNPNFPDPSPCTTTNIGLGLRTAGTEFNIPPVRKNSLWVVILLTDGVANAGYEDAIPGKYFCPESTWNNADTRDSNGNLVSILPKCNDGMSESPSNPRPAAGSPDYDAEDYAYDAADFVGHDQNALIFTIGLGPQVETPSSVDGTKLGELFLQYAADQGNGLYSYAPDSSQLREVFRKIANNIATRLAH
jgi:hypothetical protein